MYVCPFLYLFLYHFLSFPNSFSLSCLPPSLSRCLFSLPLYFFLSLPHIHTISDTHVVVSFWYHDVHLRALGTDDVTGQRIFTQVDLAAFCLVDGDGRHLTQHLHKEKLICVCVYIYVFFFFMFNTNVTNLHTGLTHGKPKICQSA